jgi:hypothetical protein
MQVILLWFNKDKNQVDLGVISMKLRVTKKVGIAINKLNVHLL